MQINIRSAKINDAERLLQIYSYYVENTAVTFEHTTPTLQEFAARIENTLKKYPYLVLEKDGIIQGYAYAGPFKTRESYDWACEMSVYVEKTQKKCGFGKMLYVQMEEVLQKMGILNLYACIAYPQTDDEYLTKNSAHFHQHLGYKICGTFHNCGYKFNRWYDMVWMEKIIGVHSKNQKPITPFCNF